MKVTSGIYVQVCWWSDLFKKQKTKIKAKPIPKTEHWNHYALKTNNCTQPLLPIHKSQVQYPLKKLLLKGNPKRQSFFSVMFSKIMWACVGNHRLKFFLIFFFFYKARGLCSRRIYGVKNEEMFRKWHILSSFILIWHTYYKIKIFKSAICFVSLITICKAKFYTCCLRQNVSGSVSGRLDSSSLISLSVWDNLLHHA